MHLFIKIYPIVFYCLLPSWCHMLNSMFIPFDWFRGKKKKPEKTIGTCFSIWFTLLKCAKNEPWMMESLTMEGQVETEHKFALAHIGSVCWGIVMLYECTSLINQCWVVGFQSILYSLQLLSIKVSVQSMVIWDKLKLRPPLKIPPHAHHGLLFKLPLFDNRFWNLTETKIFSYENRSISHSHLQFTF